MINTENNKIPTAEDQEQIEDAKQYFLSRVNDHPIVRTMNKDTIARIMIDYAEGYFQEKTRMLTTSKKT